MTSREKVLLSLCATAAVGAGIYYATGLLNSSKEAVEVKAKDYTPLITLVQVDLKKGELTNREKNVVTAATNRWLRNPLRSQPLVVEKQITETRQLPKYTGFIDIGDRPIAIIDGTDYRVGETLQGGEFKLTSITPGHVELLLNGAKESITIPLEKPPNTP